MSAPVFLAEPGSLDGVAVGGGYLLDGAEGHHAAVVQRRGPGEPVDVVDGAGVRVRGSVARQTAQGVLLDVVDVVREPPAAPAFVLVQALAKGGRDELAIETATELGVDAVVPWAAQRSVVIWRGDRAVKSQARWIAAVRTATKQARRARVPRVEAALDTAGLAARVAAVVGAGGTAIVLHEEATTPLRDVPLPAAGAAVEVLLVVGPEGGIAPAEVEQLVAAGAVTARLGPLVLRTSTAGPAALALLSDRLGRWA
ncbi:MAG: 16S rRNA (uracil(1498)-N(3))-methyltransferase [Micrococcales bacterium]|nr:16S rRNA (uracil(1498)-N(3))-methyltransferase [Micrococcales bacterium]